MNRAARIHHVGIAVRDLDEAIEWYTKRLGAEVELRATMPDQQVEAAALRMGTDRVELITPATPQAPLERFLASRGPGLHHLAYAVDDIESALAEFAAEGATLIDTKPRPGLHGHPIAFVHPRSALGVLVELVEDSAEAD